MVTAREKLTKNLKLLNEAASQIPKQEPIRWMVVYFLAVFFMIVMYVWWAVLKDFIFQLFRY